MSWLYVLLFGLFAFGLRYVLRLREWQEGIDIELERLSDLEVLFDVIDHRLGVRSDGVDCFRYEWTVCELIEFYTALTKVNRYEEGTPQEVRERVQRTVFDVLKEKFRVPNSGLHESLLVRSFLSVAEDTRRPASG